MSSVEIIVTIIVLLAVLVCYAFIMQALKQKKARRERLLVMLKRRESSFRFMLNGFPEGFLPKDLTLLVHSSLIETLEQLIQVEPQEARLAQDLQVISKKMSDAQREAGPPKLIKMSNHQQIKEVNTCLEELNKFIHLSESRGSLAKNKADGFKSYIKKLVLHVTVDAYELKAKASLQANKTKLAHHYYDLALKLLQREGSGEQKEALVAQYEKVLASLASKLASEEDDPLDTTTETSLNDELEEQWGKFAEEGDPWKKNTVYD